MQIIVLERAAFAELGELQRERQSPFLVKGLEMRFDDLEEAVRGLPLGCLAPAGTDLQDGMYESRILDAAIGDAELIARDGSNPHSAFGKYRFPFDLKIGHESRELAAELVETAVGAQVAAVFQSHVGHQVTLISAMVQPTANSGMGR